MDAIRHRSTARRSSSTGGRSRFSPPPRGSRSSNPEAFAKECKLGYRAKYIVASAKMIEAGFPEMQEIMRMPPEEAKEKLTELPGDRGLCGRHHQPARGVPDRRVVGRRLRPPLLREGAGEQEGGDREGEAGGDKALGRVELDGLLLRRPGPPEPVEAARRATQAGVKEDSRRSTPGSAIGRSAASANALYRAPDR